MSTRIYNPSILTRAISPVIIQTTPGDAPAVARDFHQYELSHIAPFNDKIGKYVGRMVAPRTFSILDAFGSGFTTPFTSFAVIQRFNYIVGAWSGPDIETMAQDSRIMRIWEDRMNCRILGFEQPSMPYSPASENYTYSVTSGRNNQRMYFTSMEEVRRLIGADIANQKGYAGQGINAVVTDTGGQRRNPQLLHMTKQTVIPGFIADENNHGTWTASALGGTRAVDHTFTLMNRNKAVVINEGVAPGVNLTEIKCLGFLVGTGTNSMLLKSLDMAISDKAQVVNVSWGGPPTAKTPQDDPFYVPMETLKDMDAIVCAASGDSGQGLVDSPGALPNVLTVGGINAVSNAQSMFGSAGEVSGFSGGGEIYGEVKPDTAGYAAIIDSAIGPVLDASYTHVVHNYGAIAGTSMSAPIVAGLMAIMYQIYRQELNRNLTLDEVKTMLSKLGHEKSTYDGWGMVTFPMIQQWLSTEYDIEM